MTQAVGTGGLLAGMRELPRGRKETPGQEGAGFGDAIKGKELRAGVVRKDEAAAEGQKISERGWKLAHALEKLSLSPQRHAGIGPEGTPLPAEEKKDAATPEREGDIVAVDVARLARPPENETAPRRRPDISHARAESTELSPLTKAGKNEPAQDAASPRPLLPVAAHDTPEAVGKERPGKAGPAGAPTRPADPVLLPGAEQQGPKTANGRAEPPRAATADAQLRFLAAAPAQETGAGEAGAGGARDAERGNAPVRVVSFQSAPMPSPAASFASNLTSAALSASLAADPGFRAAASEAARVVAAGSMRSNAPLHTLKIQLQPAELGTVTARISLSGEQLSIEIQVETAEARQRLGADSEGLTRALRALGYEVDRLTVQHAPGSNGANTGLNAGSSGTGRDAGFQAGSGSSGERGEGHSAGARREPEGRQQGTGRASVGAGDADPGSGLYI